MRLSNRENATASMINSWILSLQGSGNAELNKIVNDLIQLRRQMSSQPLTSAENRIILGRLITTTNQARGVNNPKHEACLQQMQTTIQNFTN